MHMQLGSDTQKRRSAVGSICAAVTGRVLATDMLLPMFMVLSTDKPGCELGPTTAVLPMKCPRQQILRYQCNANACSPIGVYGRHWMSDSAAAAATRVRYEQMPLLHHW